LVYQLEAHDHVLTAVAAAADLSMGQLIGLLETHGLSEEIDDDLSQFGPRWDQLVYPDLRQLVCQAFELRYLRRLLRTEPKSLSEAARKAGMDRKQLRRMLERHGMSL
jgi:DNA-binding NtrC family response regulator